MEDGGEVHSDIVQGLDEEEDAEEVRELYEEVDSDVVSGFNAEVVRGVDAEEDEEEIRQLYEELDSDVLPGSDAEGQAVRLEEMSDSASDSESTSIWRRESTSGYWRFVHALRFAATSGYLRFV